LGIEIKLPVVQHCICQCSGCPQHHWIRQRLHLQLAGHAQPANHSSSNNFLVSDVKPLINWCRASVILFDDGLICHQEHQLIPVSTEMDNRVRVQFPVPDTYFGM